MKSIITTILGCALLATLIVLAPDTAAADAAFNPQNLVDGFAASGNQDKFENGFTGAPDKPAWIRSHPARARWLVLNVKASIWLKAHGDVAEAISDNRFAARAVHDRPTLREVIKIHPAAFKKLYSSHEKWLKLPDFNAEFGKAKDKVAWGASSLDRAEWVATHPYAKTIFDKFPKMKAALAKYPTTVQYIKTHPGLDSGKKQAAK